MDISKSIPKRDHDAKAGGYALYVADHPTEGCLFGKFLRSSKPRAKIISIDIPPLPEGYFAIGYEDIPKQGENSVHIVLDDTPVFAEEIVEFIGDPILMVAGEDENQVSHILSEITVTYEELEPVFDVHKSETIFFEYGYEKGSVENAFKNADRIFTEHIRTGYQEQAYLETNGLIAEYDSEDDAVMVNGSMQCPYYVHNAIAKAMGLSPDKVRVIQDTTGGGFGGKEDYPSILACQAAVAAKKCKKPVRVIFDRREDMEFTSKRHPSVCNYKAAVKDNRVIALDIDVIYDAGAYTTLSSVVLQRGLIAACGVYNIENLRVKGRAVKTNTVPCGAFRGFGGPQTFFAAEIFMQHIAQDLSVDPLEFRLAHVSKKGDKTSTNGNYHFNVPLLKMVEEVDKAIDYRNKRELYKNQTGRYRRGIGLSMIYHGAGFTGSGERDLIKAVAKLKKHKDGKVEILVANTDMGQGLQTTFPKIIAKELNIPVNDIIYNNPDTHAVPDSGPTVASRSMMIVGELLRRCAVELKDSWVEGKEQIIEQHYKHPDFLEPFSLETFKGDAYPTYSWAVYAIELEVDTYTGLVEIVDACGSFDVGTPIDINIVTGQMEGGFMQGIGHASIEYMTASNGRIRNNSFSDYIIPTSVDIPNLNILLHVEEYPEGPYGAKGAGELPAVGAPAAYIEAIEQAIGVRANHTPFTAEDIIHSLYLKNEGGA